MGKGQAGGSSVRGGDLAGLRDAHRSIDGHEKGSWLREGWRRAGRGSLAEMDTGKKEWQRGAQLGCVPSLPDTQTEVGPDSGIQ